MLCLEDENHGFFSELNLPTGGRDGLGDCSQGNIHKKQQPFETESVLLYKRTRSRCKDSNLQHAERFIRYNGVLFVVNHTNVSFLVGTVILRTQLCTAP